MAIIPRIARMFGYDAVVTSGKRKAPAYDARSEDGILPLFQRRQMDGAAKDLQRNFSIAAWMIRKHLDYVSTFSFQCRSGNTDIDDQVESLIRWWSKKQNCDVAGRHSLARMIRLAEGSRTVAGDILVNQLDDGRLQAIESDRVQSATDLPASAGIDPERIVSGVILNEDGRATGYIVTKRNDRGQQTFDRVLSAEYCHLHGYFQRFDQVRGVSPLAPAINSLRDVYENFDYALAKAKVSQLFALAFFRDSTGGLGEASEDENDATGNGYKIDFGKGPVQLDLDPGDRAEFLESRQPSSEFQAFTQAMIGVSLKSLDIPYSYYDESYTNYSGARQAMLQYEQSAAIKRAENRDLLNALTAWRIGLFVRDGDLVLPRGMNIGDINWEWISQGLPWIDPLKEVNANVIAMNAGLASPQQICKSQGNDYYEIIDQIAEARAYAETKGVVLSSTPVDIPQEPANDGPVQN